jgi:hypothetical protein
MTERIKPDMFNPADYHAESHIGARGAFAGVVGRNVADYLMQTTQRHHMQLSQMADNKASMLITVSSLVLTVAMSRMHDASLRSGVIVLAAFTLAAMFMAILAVLPKYRPLVLKDQSKLPNHFNPIFFAHFAELERERFFNLLGEVLKSDPAIYEVLANDIYSIGTYLAKHKYRYLRWAYLFFLLGFVSALIVQIFAR